jgi:RNAse (barnase) inhibitor barstar
MLAPDKTLCKRIDMNIINIDMTEIQNWHSFHIKFKNLFGFPDYYGMNMNAWIDCMDDLVNEPTLLSFGDCTSADAMQSEIITAVMECAAFVNFRKVEDNTTPHLLISIFK